ncbi:hypothetical protein CJ030_MR3G024356 [Morella rubra]|uniref:Bulb-type lectin domain-containing protein n=1 Tax=Morella rubra TaxID=262757 RepID=A0A6A1W7C8_9ROSI|nr:hypothetical protein CJ030_MR3G024356 [Morella rubra]
MALAWQYSVSCLLFVLSLLNPTSAQISRNISLGSSLTALNTDSYWPSPSGDFAFGFKQIGMGGYLLAIWFDKIPEKTIVWSANGNNVAPRGSKVELTKDGHFVLNDPAGKEMWKAELFGSRVAYAAMLDTGNFVLATEDSRHSWETFDHPTDTILPTMTMSRPSKLVARYSETNYSYGRFQFSLRSDGNLALETRAFPLDSSTSAYWSSNTVGSGFQLVFNNSGSIYLTAKDRKQLKMITSNNGSTKDFYQRAILEHDGVFRHYIYPKNTTISSARRPSEAWFPLSTFIPSNICNAVIQLAGFVQSQQTGEAFKLFQDLLVSGIKPNPVTMTGLLPACGLMGSIKRGRQIHGLIYRMELDINIFVASALVDMYSKCGSVKNARNVFERILVKNIASWNAMIGCYGKHGMVDLAIQLFERLQEEGMQANEVTFTCILSACSHGGLVEEGLKIFRCLKESHGIAVGKEHYGCVVDLLCRSGRMAEAYELVKEMSVEVPESIFGAFFSGCKIHGRRDLAKMMAKDILGMELTKPGGYVTLSNIYAADGDWEEVEKVRKVMKEKNILKKPGFSLVERRNELVGEETEGDEIKVGPEKGKEDKDDRESKELDAIGVGG